MLHFNLKVSHPHFRCSPALPALPESRTDTGSRSAAHRQTGLGSRCIKRDHRGDIKWTPPANRHQPAGPVFMQLCRMSRRTGGINRDRQGSRAPTTASIWTCAPETSVSILVIMGVASEQSREWCYCCVRVQHLSVLQGAACNKTA